MKTLLVVVVAVMLVQPVFLQTMDLLNAAFHSQQQIQQQHQQQQHHHQQQQHQQQQQRAVTKNPAILRLQSDLSPDGTFIYMFDTENGISAQVEGTQTRTADPEQSIQTIRGQYSYTGPDNVQYTVQYIADHNGFQAFGEHLPTPPPIPEAILRSLEHNAAHPEEDDGIVAATPALAPASNPVLANLAPRSSPLQPIVAATAAPPTRSPVLSVLPRKQQQLAQTQLLAQTQVLQQQQQQQQQQQLQAQQPQPLQIIVQPQQFQPQQFPTQQLQPQQLQLTQVQPQQVQLTQLQPRQLQLQQLQSQQLQSQQLQPQQLQPQQMQPQQFQSQGQQLQPQDFLTQFAPSFQAFESQRRNLARN